LASADHYAKKHNVPADEVILLNEFLAKLLGKDLHYYVNGTHTSFCESFHALANKLCPKALVKSFRFYKARKFCAGIQWNLNIWNRINIDNPIIGMDYRVFIAEEAVMRTHQSTLLKADEIIDEGKNCPEAVIPEGVEDVVEKDEKDD
jgi:hypothetical protein